MDGCYVGRVAVDDPLHRSCAASLDEGMGVDRVRSFDAFRLNGSNEVYGYEECGSGVKLVCKFFGGASAGTASAPRGRPTGSTTATSSCAATRWSARRTT